MSYLFNDIDGMAESATKYFEIVVAHQSKVLMLYQSAHIFVASLASYRLFRETGKSIWAERARELHTMIRDWSKNGSAWNFEHKCDLLDAEEQFSFSTGGNHSDIKMTYENAIKNAIRRKFVHEAALASERAADFYCSNGNMPAALERYTRAHGFYIEWGAGAKAAKLLESVKSKIAVNILLGDEKWNIE